MNFTVLSEIDNIIFSIPDVDVMELCTFFIDSITLPIYACISCVILIPFCCISPRNSSHAVWSHVPPCFSTNLVASSTNSSKVGYFFNAITYLQTIPCFIVMSQKLRQLIQNKQDSLYYLLFLEYLFDLLLEGVSSKRFYHIIINACLNCCDNLLFFSLCRNH
ncbi:hypothetical protein OMAG_002655 [Candidatus Omnitrophus magneticus]|uniref:Uncharacterized protein n=1 Tax=Candidatus Omnitrophus magneticus TaxID=1609969 RepID=A0A0F0CJR4_9BACT|nr:hypothetical protein OMAG_002655 [Candidatus Omnitrophus magneticus]